MTSYNRINNRHTHIPLLYQFIGHYLLWHHHNKAFQIWYTICCGIITIMRFRFGISFVQACNYLSKLAPRLAAPLDELEDLSLIFKVIAVVTRSTVH